MTTATTIPSPTRNELLERIDKFILRALEMGNGEIYVSRVGELLQARVARLRLLRRAVEREPHERIPPSFEEAFVTILSDRQPTL